MAASKPQQAPAPAQLSPFSQLISGGLAACVAEVATLPFDTGKVRLQILGEQAAVAGAAAQPKLNMFSMIGRIARDEGPRALWKGLSPGLQRQMVFASIRIGAYDSVRSMYSSDPNNPTLLQRIAAGLTTGAIGITVASPMDLVKVRLQAEGRRPPGQPPRYTGSLDAYRKVIRAEGLRGLWSGYAVNLARNSVISCAELVTYDLVKSAILGNGLMEDGAPCHVVSGLSAGFVATVIGSPIDVTKTRFMNSKPDANGVKPYTSALDCAAKTFRNEGIRAFWNGFGANFTRIGMWNVVCFFSLEKIRAGLRSLEAESAVQQ